MAVGVVAMFGVNLIDTYWASRLGTDALAAMSFAFPVIGVVLSVSVGLMIGTSVAVSRVVGEGRVATARRLATHAMLLALGIVVLLAGIGWVTIDPLFTLLGAPRELLGPIGDYMEIWYLSAGFLVVPMMLNGVLRAYGDAITARNVMILAAVFNGVLDPLFIFGVGSFEGWGLQGAAAATGLSRALTFVYALVVAFRMDAVDLHLPGATELWHSSRTILSVGLPATLTNVLGPLATAVLTAIVATHGAEAVAAYGIGARVESLLLIPAMALSSGLSPFVGQNWGAHLPKRVAEAFSVSARFSMAWGALAWLGMLGAAPVVAAAFTDEPTVHADIVLYLRVVPVGYGAYSVMMMVSAAFNAVDRAMRATVLSVLRSVVLAVPLALVGSSLFGLTGIFGALAISSIAAAAIGARWMVVFLRAEAPQTVDTGAALTEAAFLVERTRPESRPVMQQLVDTMLSLEDVDLHRTRSDAVGFFVGNRELGHIHPSGHLDMPLPPEVGDALVRLGRMEHHRMQDGGWYSHDLRSVEDAQHAQWLLQLAHALYEVAKRGVSDPLTQSEFETLSLQPDVQRRVEDCAVRWGTP
ncbi:MAG: MATE family efflux transporter [Myxococcales bacterium]|nr:MATE family efflux transporter [Myxococcales bacterium]